MGNNNEMKQKPNSFGPFMDLTKNEAGFLGAKKM
jgi:hypothetical protein